MLGNNNKSFMRLDTMEVKLDTLIAKLDSVIQNIDKLPTVKDFEDLQAQSDIDPAEAEVQKPQKEETGHIDIAVGHLGVHEEDDPSFLPDFLGIDPDELSWCGYFVGACLKRVGLMAPASPGVAKSYALLGYDKVEEPRKGDLAVWNNHVAFFYGYAERDMLSRPAKYGKVTSLEEWDDVRSDMGAKDKVAMVLGGNQSDMVNISPAEWYDNYSDFLGYYRVA